MGPPPRPRSGQAASVLGRGPDPGSASAPARDPGLGLRAALLALGNGTLVPGFVQKKRGAPWRAPRAATKTPGCSRDTATHDTPRGLALLSHWSKCCFSRLCLSLAPEGRSPISELYRLGLVWARPAAGPRGQVRLCTPSSPCPPAAGRPPQRAPAGARPLCW